MSTSAHKRYEISPYNSIKDTDLALAVELGRFGRLSWPRPAATIPRRNVS